MLYLVGGGVKPLINQDFGFRVLKLDSSNMRDVFYEPAAVSQQDLLWAVSNIQPDRSSEDLLFQIMLELGIELSSSIDSINLSSGTAYSVASAPNLGTYFLVSYLEDELNTNDLISLAKLKSIYLVLKNSAINSDSLLNNYQQLVKSYSPDTIIRLL